MEEEELLFKIIINSSFVRIVIIPVVIFTFIITYGFSFSGSFEEAVDFGRDLGTQIIQDFNPQNIDSTLQQKGLGPVNQITPNIDEAHSQQESYTQFYTNPGGMVGVEGGEADKFVEDSYFERQKFNLSQDPVFGNQCLEWNDLGRCSMWSTSKDLITNIYPDCEKVILPQYGETREEICVGFSGDRMYDCEVRMVVSIITEEVQGPCSQVLIEDRPGQIYAVCRDYKDWYKVLKQSFLYSIIVDHNYQCQGVICGASGGCPPTLWMWDRDAYVVQNVNQLPLGSQWYADSLTYVWLVKAGDDWWCNGYLYGFYTAPRKSVIERVIISQDSPCGANFNNWLNQCVVYDYQKCNSNGLNCVYLIKDGEATGQSSDTQCQSFPTSINQANYEICSLPDSSQGIQINGTVVTGSPYRYYFSTWENDLEISWQVVLGGSGVKENLNDWWSKVRFVCDSDSGNCQPLIDAGCVPYSARCLDSDCNQVEYIYRCGTSGITGYSVAYNCLGEIRCLGTDCADASYEANTDFVTAASAIEVLNQYRVDSAGGLIFPGELKYCQSGPKNCCKQAGGGVSIGDYVNAARQTIALYSVASGGYSATWASFANAFTYALSSGEAGTLSGLLGNTISNALGTTTSVIYTSPGVVSYEAANAMGVTVTSGGVTEVTMVNAELISTLATLATVITIAISVYSVLKFAYDWYFQCTRDDIIISSRLQLGLCHYIGQIKSKKLLGLFTKKTNYYCCFNSILARIVHEQGRPQIGLSWGSPYSPNCRGFSPEEFSSIDFSRIDLREYMQYVEYKTEISPQKMEEIINRIKQVF